MAADMLRGIVWFSAVSACAAASVSDAFPTATTTNLEMQCGTGFSIGGGVDAAAQSASWTSLAPCRLHCECVAKDGSCKYCCKNSGSTCERHLPLYKYATDSCLKCDWSKGQFLHEAGVSGYIGKSDVDATQQWVARGSSISWDLVANSAGHRFNYYSGFLACWNGAGSGNSAQAASSCTAFEATESTSALAPVGTETEYVPTVLSSVLNQGGCGNCYVQATMAATTDRALLKMSSSERTSWTSSGKSFSTGYTTRCHFTPGTGDSCDGGVGEHVMNQLAGKQGGTNKPALDHVGTCTGGVYGGPNTPSPYSEDHADYFSKWNYGCVHGCTPFQAGFSGSPLPSGSMCRDGYTDDVATMKAGLLSPLTTSNFDQFSNSCGCGGTLSHASTGSCTYCGAFKGGSLYPFGQWATITADECNWAGISTKFSLPSSWTESDFTSFAMTGEAVTAWTVSQGHKEYALTSLGCPAATQSVAYGTNTKCTKCCKPMPYPQPGYQYSAEDKAAQSPPTCTGSGVTAGSTPGQPVCSVGTCPAQCDTTSDTTPVTKVLFDNSEHSVYTPIGMIYGDAGYDDWHPMFEHFIKDEIKQHGPMYAGFSVPHNFGTFFNTNPTGIMEFSSSDSPRLTGGHAVSIVGWGESSGKKYWLVRNSWGRSFADSGYFRMEIGGGASSKLGFATNKGPLTANSGLLRTGSFRRMSANSTAKAEARKLSTASKTASTIPKQTHGSSGNCTDHHKPEVDALRTWFLKNSSNYMGIEASCAVPWTWESSGECSVQVAHPGMILKTSYHVKDCNDKKYHITVRISYDMLNVNTGAKIIANTGPKVLKQDTVLSDGDPSEVGSATSVTSSSWRASASLAAASLAAASVVM